MTISFSTMSQTFDELIRIIARLRGPGGCPWDHEQTHESILPQLIEETYEVASTIEQKNYPHLCEELGDLLLHILFHSQMASERGDFLLNFATLAVSLDRIAGQTSSNPRLRGPKACGNISEIVDSIISVKSPLHERIRTSVFEIWPASKMIWRQRPHGVTT